MADTFGRKELPQAMGYEPRATCEHEWQPCSFVFETRSDVAVFIRQPKIVGGRVYCVCMKCASHTYIATQWIGYYLGGDEEPTAEESDG